MTKHVVIQPFETIRVQGITKVRNHQKQIHIMVEPKQSLSGTVSAIPTYLHLKPGSSKVSVGLWNYSCRPITLKAKSMVANISAANAIPGKIALKELGGNISEGKRQGKMPPN